MAFTIPTLPTLLARSKGDLNSRLGDSNSYITRSLSWVAAQIVPAAVYGLYQYQKYIMDQVFPDTAEGEYQERWARIFGIYRVAASKASGSIPVAGSAGSTIPNSAAIQVGGVAYVVTGGPYTCLAAPAKVSVAFEAVATGTAGNAVVGTAFEFVSPPAGVVARNLLTVAVTNGRDAETVPAMLIRLLQRIQTPPQGGSRDDYERWTRDAGVDAVGVWVESWIDAGSILADGYVAVYFTVAGTGADVIPTAPDRAIVTAYILSRQPAEAGVTIASPTPNAFTLALSGHLDGTRTGDEIEADIATELEATFADRVTVGPLATTVPNSDIHAAVARVPGMDYFTLTNVDGSGNGTADLALAAHEYPTVIPAGIALTEV
jgi:uncharacterized phage protein gp47/JayE